MATSKDGFHVQTGNREVVTGVFISLLTGALFATTKALLRALPADFRAEGLRCFVLEDRSNWVFDADSELADTTNNVVMTPSAGSGRWLRADASFVLKAPVAFGLADGATIFTVPEGFALRLAGFPYWEVTAAWTGGSSSSIGISSSKTGFTAAGSLLGGAAGDVAATLDAGVAAGTVGVGMDSLAEIQAGLFVEGDTITYEEITSAFDAGAGFACIPVLLVNSPATP